MKKYFYLLALLMPLAMTACNDDKESTIDGTSIDVKYGGTSIETALEFSLGAGFQMLQVSSDGDWTATIDDSSIEYDPSDTTQVADISRWIAISNHAGAPDRYVADDDTTYASWVKISFKYNESIDRTASITFKSGDVSKSVTIVQQGAGADPGDYFQTAYLFRESLKVGYNLGNTLDAAPAISKWFNPTSDLDYETSWGQPVTTQEIIDSIVAKGFNVIRVPVTWHPHFDVNEDGTVTVHEIWMDRVQEVVDYVINTGVYCILNVQHDTGERGSRTDGAGWLKADMDEYPASSVKFKSLWEQIATRFIGYDEHLLFEAFNEILDADDSWVPPTASAPYQAITKLEQDFVDVVRATGGNNEYRNLVVNTYAAAHSQVVLDNFQVPTDVHRGHLLASIHSYDPYNFCCDNEDWNISTFDASCTNEIDELFAMINTRFNNLGIPYIYGEFGAIHDDEDVKPMGERVKYAQYMMQKFDAYGTAGLWWMGLFNRKTLKWYEPEIVNALVK